MKGALVVLLILLPAASPARGDAQAPRTIDPGMSRAQVVERLGPPVTASSTGSSTFLYYRNGCERRCGMHDLVVLDSGSVVDAIFRSAERRYTGVSSSPEPVPPRQAGGRSSTRARPEANARSTRRPGTAGAARSEIRIPMDSKKKPEV